MQEFSPDAISTLYMSWIAIILGMVVFCCFQRLGTHIIGQKAYRYEITQFSEGGEIEMSTRQEKNANTNRNADNATPSIQFI